ncbi:Grm2, partial [Symbiodinium sp. CCMP2592]
MAGHGLRSVRPPCSSVLLFSLSFVRCASVEFALGVLAGNPQLHATAAAAFIDYQKNFNASLTARLGPPIIEIPGGVHPNASMGAISLSMKDDGDSDKTGMSEALNLLLGLEGNAPVIGLIASLDPVATLTGVRQIPQVSCYAEGPKLSNKKEYPFFVRTTPPDSFLATAIWHWVVHFNVPAAACVYSDEGYGQSLFGSLNDLARANGQQDRIQGQGLGRMSLLDFNAEQAREVAQLVKRIGSHFVVLLIHVAFAGGFFNVLEQEGMVTPAWQILSTDTFQADAGRKVGYMYLRPSGEGAKAPELRQLWSWLSPHDMEATNQMQLPAGLVGDEMFDEGAVFDPIAFCNFDSVYAYFIAINNLLHSGVDASEVRGRALLDEMSRLGFNGVSGDMSFDRNGDRLGAFEFLNVQSDGNIASVASFSAKTLNFTVTAPLTWMDGSVGYFPPPDMYSCDPGFYQEEQTRQCKICPQGNFCEGGLTAPLMPCPRGTFAPDVGMTNCTACPNGSFALDA